MVKSVKAKRDGKLDEEEVARNIREEFVLRASEVEGEINSYFAVDSSGAG